MEQTFSEMTFSASPLIFCLCHGCLGGRGVASCTAPGCLSSRSSASSSGCRRLSSWASGPRPACPAPCYRPCLWCPGSTGVASVTVRRRLAAWERHSCAELWSGDWFVGVHTAGTVGDSATLSLWPWQGLVRYLCDKNMSLSDDTVVSTQV